jgi:hypothetical protein
MMYRLFWPLLSWVLLLEGFFLNRPLGWMVAAAAIALFGYLACEEAIRTHRALDEIIARMNAEKVAARAEQADTRPTPTTSAASAMTAVVIAGHLQPDRYR